MVCVKQGDTEAGGLLVDSIDNKENKERSRSLLYYILYIERSGYTSATKHRSRGVTKAQGTEAGGGLPKRKAQKQGGGYLSILGPGPCTQPDRDPDGPLGRLYRCGCSRSQGRGGEGRCGEERGDFVVGLVVVGLVVLV